jgi:hypothetical protein
MAASGQIGGPDPTAIPADAAAEEKRAPPAASVLRTC